jgi:uncharacterized protein
MRFGLFLKRLAAAGLVAGLAAWPAPGHADGNGAPGLWHVTGPKGSIYLMGSVHVLTEADSWMTASIDAAFKQSQCLALEIDLATIPPETISARLRAVGQYDPRAGGLKDHVSDKTYQRFLATMQDLALSPESLDSYRPWLVSLIISSVITDTLGYEDRYGVDYSFMTRAQATKMPIMGLETLDDQVAALSASDGETDDEILGEVLDSVGREPSTIKTVAEAWRRGDMETIAKKIDEELADEPMDYDRLIGRRNRHWLPELEKMLKTGRHCFVVVGAGHLVGKASLLTLLIDAGYTVTRE